MTRWTRRILWLVLLLVAGAALSAGARRRVERSVPAPSAAPRWPPFDPQPAGARDGGASSIETVRFAVDLPADLGPSVAPWVLPVDGGCPESHPIKANDNSGIYHVPGGRSYERTKPERCYVDAESAAADGYRAAKG